jgi:threonine/homoserine/homoserine lactone efflux protein
MSYELLVAFASFALVASITPGPNNLMLMASGTNFGYARTIPHMLGVSFGFTAMVLMIGLGLSQVFTAFPAAHVVLKVACVVYMLYLAFKIATSSPHPKQGRTNAKPMTFLQAVAFQWVNPKGWSMALTAVTAYAVGNNVWSYVLVALVFGIINMPSICVWMAMGVQLRQFLSNPRAMRAFNIVAAVLLIGSLYPVVFSH